MNHLGVASAQVQRVLELNLRQILSESAGEHVLADGSRMCTAMWLDLDRAVYTLNHDGDSAPLLGTRKRSEGTQNHRRDSAVSRLQGLTVGNGRQLNALSRVANTNAMAGIHAAMLSPHSPIRLPDGTPGRLLGRGLSSFDIRRGADGKLQVRCAYEISEATFFVDAAPSRRKPVPLRKGMGARFTYSVEISCDGGVRIADPLRCEYRAQPEACSGMFGVSANAQDPLHASHARLHRPTEGDSHDESRRCTAR